MGLPSEDAVVMRRIDFHLPLRKFCRYLQENPDQPIHLAAAARVACMEKTAFSRFFRRATGVKFHDFVLSWRVQRAIELMTLSDRSLTEIAFESGFQNLATFDRSFKKFFGCTPFQYRTKLLESCDLIGQSHELTDKCQEVLDSSQKPIGIVNR